MDNHCPEIIFKNRKRNDNKRIVWGTYKSIKGNQKLPLRKVAAALDIDPSTLSKIERGERSANKEMLPLLADLFNESEEDLGLILMSDKVAYDLMQEENPDQILKVAEEKIKYLKNKNLQQGSLDL